jgi:hypothetical protein
LSSRPDLQGARFLGRCFDGAAWNHGLGRAKIIAFIQEREEVMRILRHLKMRPIAYPKHPVVEARVSPFYISWLRKLSD